MPQNFAQVLLPLPLHTTFTYAVPDDMSDMVEKGSRVLVQFGRKKYYTGIITELHVTPPTDYEVKPIMAVLDREPVVRYPQLKLWDWIADYYLCTPGEVYKAALPTGLKPESETHISLNPDFEQDGSIHFTPRQQLIISVLEEKNRVRISEIEESAKLKAATQVANQLLEMGVVVIDEKVTDKYKPKKETFVVLNARRGDNDLLHEYFSKVSRSRKQEATLISWLELSGWLSPAGDLKEVTRDDLIKKAGVTPAILKSLEDKGILTRQTKIVNRFNTESSNIPVKLATLSEEQSRALSEIKEQFSEKNVVLLRGVTGSGKTEIYTHLMQMALNDGNQVLYLVPEISLTTQLTDRLRKVFGDRLLVYHSRFTDNERVDIWKKMLSSHEPMIILGARSSVFLPFARLGLVVVDEEHESSFKQYDPAPRYNARDVAIVLASMHGAKTLLGSATPSIETYFKSKNGKYGLVELHNRFEGAGLPDVEIVDMKIQRKKKLSSGILSSVLSQTMRRSLSEGKQAILFLNRRGFAPVVICNQCGWTPKCENCDVSLVYHKNTDLLKCHYCGFSRTLPKLCPACGQNSIDIFGYGTERIAEEIHQKFEGYRVARMDLDSTRNRDSYQEIIEEFSRKDTDILVGTQMVTKGLDFKDVKVVGVVNADTLLNFPDFRSNERAFNMLEQVAGRAGRRNEKGTVIIQTTRSDDPLLEYVKRHDYLSFYDSEIKEREKFKYPPFARIINIYLKHKDAMSVDRAAVIFTQRLKQTFGERVLGPEKPFVSRVATWHLQSIMLKVEGGASMKKVKLLLRNIYENCANIPEIKSSVIYYDVDPV